MRRRNWFFALISAVALLTLIGCSAAVTPTVPQIPPSPAVDAGDDEMEVAPSAESTPPVSELTSAEETVAPPEPSIQPGPVIPASVDVVLSGGFVTVPLDVVEEAVNAQFSVTLDERLLDFMAYILDGRLFVRASACPPCDSREFLLDGANLVCDSCSTTFDASTGDGIDGACIDYPKAAVTYDITGGVVRMGVADLVRAYDETLSPGWGPLAPEIVVVEEPEPTTTRPSCCG